MFQIGIKNNRKTSYFLYLFLCLGFHHSLIYCHFKHVKLTKKKKTVVTGKSVQIFTCATKVQGTAGVQRFASLEVHLVKEISVLNRGAFRT